MGKIWGRGEMHTKFGSENLMERGHFGDLCVDNIKMDLKRNRV
jgi:hypothetical protein